MLPASSARARCHRQLLGVWREQLLSPLPVLVAELVCIEQTSLVIGSKWEHCVRPAEYSSLQKEPRAERANSALAAGTQVILRPFSPACAHPLRATGARRRLLIDRLETDSTSSR